MQIFVSTTWLGTQRTDIAAVLDAMAGIEADGVELGSTHLWHEDLAEAVMARWNRAVFTHNYFPPAPHELIVDLASSDESVREASLNHARECLRFAARIGARLYTVHPGYVVAPQAATLRPGGKNFDFVYDEVRGGHADALERMIAALADLAETAARLGVKLAVETQGSITQPNVCLLERTDDYERLMTALGGGLAINFNLAHSTFAAKLHGFALEAFVERFRHSFAAVELSHNDGTGDQHRPLVPESPAVTWAARLADLPLILEFRNAGREDLNDSLAIIREVLARQPEHA